MSAVTIPDDLMARIRQHAETLNMSVEDFVEAALESRVGQLAYTMWRLNIAPELMAEAEEGTKSNDYVPSWLRPRT